MRWLKHLTMAHADDKVSAVLEEMGPVAYGIYWLLAEHIAAPMEPGKMTPEMTKTDARWAHLCFTSARTLRSVVNRLAEKSLIESNLDGNRRTIGIPKILKYKDEYSKMSGVTPEKVPTRADTDREQRESRKKADTDTHKAAGSGEPVSGLLGVAFLESIGWRGGWKHIRKANADQVSRILELRESDIEPGLESLDSLHMIWARLNWFEEFWLGYWRKADKKAARIAYFESVTALDLHDRVVAAVEAQTPMMMARPEDKRPHAATWIHRERWNDDVERTEADE